MTRKSHRILRQIAFLCLLLPAFFLTQCRPQPRGVLATDEMKNVVREMLLLEASFGGSVSPSDSLFLLQKEALLDKYGLTGAEYDSSMVWYARNAQLLSKIYEELAAEFAEQGALLDSAIVDSTELYRIHYVPTLSLWNGPSRFVIPSERAVYYHSQPVPGLLPGDTVDFSANIQPPLSKGQELEVLLLVKDTADVVRDRQSVLFLPGMKLKASFVLPAGQTGGAANPLSELYFKYRFRPSGTGSGAGSHSFITFDSVTLSKRMPPPPPIQADPEGLSEQTPDRGAAETSE